MSKITDTGASSWQFYFCILILARYKNENKHLIIASCWCFLSLNKI